jgi:arabinofuranosyltransferase
VAALLALTRPDGLLFVAVTGALAIAQARLEPSRREAARSLLVGVSPWVVVIIHELWRLSFYGAWLPNTYYAKVVEPWPASGVRYATSYVVEYALWFPVLAAIALAVRRGIPRPSRATFGSLIASRAVPFVVTVAVAIHLLYYTLIVGGDHFEYRVYSYTIPLLFVGIAYVFNRAQCRPWTALALMSTFILLSAPVPWTHWAKTRHLTTRGETQFMFVPIASSWPKPVAWYARIFDRSQSWLIRHAVCMRHQEHKVFWRTQANGHPTRAEGAKIPGDGFPVFASYTVGVPSWVFPNVNVIDMFGLNDYVIARAPYPKDKQRFMAHGRKAPEGYVESYRPNVTERGWVAPRRGAISATGIACLEDYWRACLPQIRRGVGTFDYANACPP